MVEAVSSRSHASFMGGKMALDNGMSNAQENQLKNEKAIAEGMKPGGLRNESIAQNYKEIASAEQMLSGAETRIIKIDMVKNRVESSARAIDEILKIAQDVHVTMTSAQKAAAQDEGFGTYCERKFDELINVLNRRNSQGDGMFGGADRQRNAVDPVTGDFQGEAKNHVFTLEGVRVEYGFHANDPAIRDLFDVLSQGKSSAIDDLGPLQDKMHGVTKGLTVIKREVDEQILTLENAKSKAVEDAARYKQTFSDLVGVDEMQVTLEASRERLKLQALLNLQIEQTAQVKQMLQLSQR